MTCLLVCGGRDFQDRARLREALEAIHRESSVKMVISGGAAGADTLAAEWAIAREGSGVELAVMRPEWRKHGKAAGPIRNQQMLERLLQYPGQRMVVAFQGGRGTADMVSRAKASGVTVLEG